MLSSTDRLKSSSQNNSPAPPKRPRTSNQQRDSHHDWNANKNKSVISAQDLHYDEFEATWADKFCHLFAKLPILSPFGKFRCSWDVIVMFMLIYTSLEVPLTLGFKITLSLSGEYYRFGIIALVIDICLCVDILLNFRTAFFDKYDDLRLITDTKRIAKRYFKGWFWIDLLTSFPFEFIIVPDEAHGSSSDSGNVTTYLKMLRIFRLFRIFKILRLLKMVKLFDGFMSSAMTREMMMVMRLIKVLCAALLSAHMCACFWYAIGCESHSVYDTSWLSENDIVARRCGVYTNMNSEDDSLVVRYSYSWYWSVVTLFTTGYGDIVATNVYEQWAASVVILIGTCLFGYFVGTMTSIITEGDKVSSSIVSKIEDAQHFCQQKLLPANMARAVLTHTRYHCNHNYVLGDEQDVLSNLPSYLAMDVSLYISRKYLENLDFFSNHFLDPYIRGLIALKMKSISCNAGYKLFVKGDVSEKIYIQRIGKSNHFIYDPTNPKKKPVKKRVSRGDVVGEYAPILKQRESTLVCETWCEFYVLDVADIKEVLEQHYHQIWNKKWQNILKFLKKEYLKPVRKRKRRKALLQDNPFLPSFKSSGDLETDAASGKSQYNVLPNNEHDGDQGHVNWESGMNTQEKKLHNLHKLERLTTQILSANANDLNNHNINFGLNALSAHASEISQISNKKNRKYITSKILDPLSQTTKNLALHPSQSLFRGLTRNNSFLRDLEVRKDYHREQESSSSSSSSDEGALIALEIEADQRFQKEEANNVKEEHEKCDTADVADFISNMEGDQEKHGTTIQMMKVQQQLNTVQPVNDEQQDKNNNEDEKHDDISDEDEDEDEESLNEMISNVYTDIGDYNDKDDEAEDEYEDDDSNYSDSGEQNETNNAGATGNRKRNKKKKGGHRKKKKRKTQKAHS